MASTRYRPPRPGQGYHRFHGVPLGGEFRHVHVGRWLVLAAFVALMVLVLVVAR